MFANLYGELGKKRMSIAELARMIEVNPKTLSNKLNGKTDFTYTEMLKIKEILNGETLDILFEKTEKVN